jgi:hypothetical protein
MAGRLIVSTMSPNRITLVAASPFSFSPHPRTSSLPLRKRKCPGQRPRQELIVRKRRLPPGPAGLLGDLSEGGLQIKQCRSLRSLSLLFSALLFELSARQRSKNNNAPPVAGALFDLCGRGDCLRRSLEGALTQSLHPASRDWAF